MDSAQVNSITIAEMAKFTGMVMEMGSRRKSNPEKLAQAFNDFATTPAQAESFEETFRTAGPSSKSYHDARLCLQMCKLCKFESVGIDSVLRGAKSEIRSMRNRNPESYGSTMVYFAYCGMSFSAWWINVFGQAIGRVTSEFTNNLDRLKQLRAAGYDISRVQAMYKALQDDTDIKSSMLLQKAEDLPKFYVVLMKALAENLENPDAVDSQTIDAFQWYADAFSGTNDDLAVRRLGDDVRKILDRNRAAYQKKYHSSSEYKKKVKEWWDSHPDAKARLEKDIARERSEITKLKRKQKRIQSEWDKAMAEARSTMPADLTARLADIRSKRNAQLSRKSELEETLRTLGLFKFKQKNETKAQIDQVDNELASTQHELDEVEGQVSKKQAEIAASLDAINKSYRRKMTGLEDDISRKKRLVESLTKQLKEPSEVR